MPTEGRLTIADLFDRYMAAPRAASRLRVPATERLERLRFVAIDSETTGLAARRDRIVSIAAVPGLGLDFAADATLDLLVHPGVPIPARASEVHGIDDAAVVGAPSFAAAWPRIEAALRDSVVVGHHVAFDLAILAAECRRHGLPWIEPPSLCTQAMALALDPGAARHDLAELVRRHAGREPDGVRHSAAGDARMAAQLYVALARRFVGTGRDTWGRLAASVARAAR